MHANASLLSEWREHNIFALNLLNVYLLLLEGGMLSGFQTPVFLKRISVKLLLNKLETAKYNDIALSEDEWKTLYAAYVLDNKLLNTEKGEYLGGMITQQLEAAHALKDYARFRVAMVMNNERLIVQVEEDLLTQIHGFTEWKKVLSEFQVIQ